ncbi:MAG: ABC transporter substrate-binding protein [Sphaerochaetaceae bacterium]
MSKKIGALFLVLCFSFILLGKGKREEIPMPIHPPLSEHKTFAIGMLKTEDPLFLNPAAATDIRSTLILDGLFEGLYSLDPQSADPIAAIAIETTVSNNGRIWTIRLDPRARFSNGDPITAATFIESWFWLLDNKDEETGNSYVVTMMECIEGVKGYREGSSSKSSVGLKALGPYVLEIRLVSAAPYLKALLATLPFSAIHSSNRNGTFFPIISSGAFEIREQNADYVLLGKQNWYRRWEEVKSDFIRFDFLQPKELQHAYSNHQIHWSLDYIPFELLHSPTDLRLSPEYSTGFYYFSSASGPYANANVKKALSLFIPWEEIRQTSGQIFPTKRLIPFQYNGTTEISGSQQAEALRLLAAEGYPYGAGLPTLSMAVHSGSFLIEASSQIADQWSKELGITVVLDVVPLGVYSRYPELSPYDFAFMTWIGDFHDPFAFLNLFRGESRYNLSNVVDKTYDELVSAAMIEPTQKAIRKAEQHLLDQGTVIPLYHGMATNIIDSLLVRGWYENELNIHPLRYLELTSFEQ